MHLRFVRRRKLTAGLALMTLAIAMALPMMASGHEGHHFEPTDRDLLAGVRQATVQYHDVEAAKAAGYVELALLGNLCYESPDHGAMGIHYVNPALAGDSEIDPLRPELLIYFPHGNSLELVAVEYFTAYTGQPAPEVMGVPMNGPYTHLEPQIGPHYQLHFWIWQGNPAGVAASFNPNLDCD